MNGLPLNAGCMDGEALVDMNNLSVGYFPSKEPTVGVYPPPKPTTAPAPTVVHPQPVGVPSQASETNS
jgi:hypothetical protein